MKTVACEACRVEHPMREMFDVHGRTLCKACAERFAGERKGEVEVRRSVDPTICVNCGADNGDAAHPTLMRLPTCAKCVDFYRNRPFPTWIRAAGVALALLVIFSLAWNWRFFQAHFELKAALRSHDLKEAARLSQSAAEHVPESEELGELADFYQGVVCLMDDKCQEAQSHLSRCARLPPDFHAGELLEQAQIGAAFDRKDYGAFLQMAQSVAERNARDPMAQAQLASALACAYAVRGDEDLKRQAEAKLDEAKKSGPDALKKSDYEQRIRHRLETREIINRQEFMRRFPKGWKPSGGSKP